VQGHSTKPEGYAQDGQDHLQTSIMGTLKATGDAMKNLRKSIDSKRLPWFPLTTQSPLSSVRQTLRDGRSDSENGNGKE